MGIGPPGGKEALGLGEGEGDGIEDDIDFKEGATGAELCNICVGYKFWYSKQGLLTQTSHLIVLP